MILKAGVFLGTCFFHLKSILINERIAGIA
jgi:hypothetical protein